MSEVTFLISVIKNQRRNISLYYFTLQLGILNHEQKIKLQIFLIREL